MKASFAPVSSNKKLDERDKQDQRQARRSTGRTPTAPPPPVGGRTSSLSLGKTTDLAACPSRTLLWSLCRVTRAPSRSRQPPEIGLRRKYGCHHTQAVRHPANRSAVVAGAERAQGMW